MQMSNVISRRFRKLCFVGWETVVFRKTVFFHEEDVMVDSRV